MNTNNNSEKEKETQVASEGWYFRFFSCFFQIAVWASIGYLLYAHLRNSNDLNENDVIKIYSYWILGINYPIYLSFQLCSSTIKFLNNVKTSLSFHEYMRELFETPITITFITNSFFYWNRRPLTQDKIYTHTGSKDFYYYTWRDTSGKLILYPNEETVKNNISFIGVWIKPSYKFFDLYTENDFYVQRNKYFKDNQWRERNMETSTSYDINGRREYILLKVNELSFISKYWFIFFSIIATGELYKCYFNSKTRNVKIEVKKEISTRININSSNYDQRFIDDIPRIVFKEVETLFNITPKELHDTPICPNPEDLLSTEETGGNTKIESKLLCQEQIDIDPTKLKNDGLDSMKVGLISKNNPTV